MAHSLSKKDSFKIFDGIAGRYDFINSVLSVGLHRGWRRQLRAQVLQKPGSQDLSILDLATGTGDVALTLAESARISQVVGIDLSNGMLEVGRSKVKAANLERKVRLQYGDAMHIKPTGFDAVTMSFGIRNVPDAEGCLRQIFKVLKSGGQVVVLEFALPRQRWFRALHLFYLRHVLPQIGRMLSGHSFAYRYLNETIETFPYGGQFTEMMQRAGFVDSGFKPLSLGIVNLYYGVKP